MRSWPSSGCGTAQPGWLNLSSASTPRAISVRPKQLNPERCNIVGGLRRVRSRIHMYRQALHDFEKERGRRGETESTRSTADIYPPENGK